MTTIVVGLGFGDEGKGATVDAIVARAGSGAVIRFNGGQQAAHNVMAGGLHHTFQSYGSGTLSGAETWISRYCTVEPTAALKERVALEGKGVHTEDLRVDEECLVTSPVHIAINRAMEEDREHAGEGRHGSTGRGFGETVRFGLECPDAAPRVKHLFDGTYTRRVMSMYDWYRTQGVRLGGVAVDALGDQITHARHSMKPVTHEQVLERIAVGDTVMEGAQGFWLDENFGFSPHTTWSTTTPANARRLCREAGVEPVTVGVLRTYATRHGQGPFPGEGGIDRPPEPHNSDGAFAGEFRVGRWDETLLQTAVKMTMPDVLSLTHLDRFPSIMVGGGIMAAFELGVPLGVWSFGPHREERVWYPVPGVDVWDRVVAGRVAV